jgi:hypothetical protein
VPSWMPFAATPWEDGAGKGLRCGDPAGGESRAGEGDGVVEDLSVHHGARGMADEGEPASARWKSKVR